MRVIISGVNDNKRQGYAIRRRALPLSHRSRRYALLRQLALECRAIRIGRDRIAFPPSKSRAVASNLSVLGSNPSTLLDQLLAGWKLDEASNATRVNVTGRNNLLDTNSNVPAATGLIGNAAGVFADNTHTLLTAAPIITSGPFTLACWFNQSAAPAASAVILGQITSIAAGGIRLQTQTSTVRAGVGSGASLGVATVSTGIWHHFVMTYDGTALKAYYDGVYKVTGTQTADYTGAKVSVGSSAGGGDNYTTGLVDEAYIWGKVLGDGGVSTTQTAGGEIALLYQAGLAGVGFPWPGF